jgi:hypothetical protein
MSTSSQQKENMAASAVTEGIGSSEALQHYMETYGDGSYFPFPF